MSHAESFIEKLKDQSFTIMILVGVMYYQNHIFTQQMAEYKQMVMEKDRQINQVLNAERQRLLDREKYLIEQRDAFIDEMRKENGSK
jgi:hypothetical protein